MTEIFAKWTITLFGLFFIYIGVIMQLKPATARNNLRKAGSTNFINYAEITFRILPATALILSADDSKDPDIFNISGWFILLTSPFLYFGHRKLHPNFSNKSADDFKL